MGIARKAHYLKENKRSAFPRHIIFFDTETNPITTTNGDILHILRLGAALYWCRYKDRVHDTLQWLYFKTNNEFWDFVCKHTYNGVRTVCLAHNLQFDFMVLSGFRELKSRGWNLSKVISNQRVNVFKFISGRKTLVFMDTQNWFNTSVKRLGDVMGLPKLAMPDMSEDDSVWFKYCARDVEILYRAFREWIEFLNQNDLGNFGITLASQAFNAYRHRFMPVKILIHNNIDATQLERDSYRGGRCECFYIGKLEDGIFFKLDVNSMYPFVMYNYPYPIRLRKYVENPSVHSLRIALAKYCVIADVVVCINEPIFGVRLDGKLIFPIGTFRAQLCTNELKAALSYGTIHKIYRMAVYEADYIFRDYVSWFYQQRKLFNDSGNSTFAYLCKLMLNSLYGKFGQRNEVWKEIGEDNSDDDWVEYWVDAETGKCSLVRCINGKMYQTLGLCEAYNAFPAISSEVTANARMYLWRLISDAGRENVFYVDTDSLIVDGKGYKRLREYIHPYVLGLLKVEDVANCIEIRGLKDYSFGNKTYIKGVPANAKKIADNTYETYQMIGLRQSLHGGDCNQMVWKKIEKTLSREYDKGVVEYNGWVRPFNICVENNPTLT